MNRISFWEGIGIALLGSVVGSVGFFALTFLFSENFAIRLLISGLAFVYILYLLHRSQGRIGRITVIVSLILLFGLLAFLNPPLGLFLIIHVLAIWLIRSLYCYASLFSSLVDLGLNVLSIASAFWALHHSGSLFLAIWCFFLVQALFVYIPKGAKQTNLGKTAIPENDKDFKRAYQAAEAAVRKLSTFN